MVPVQLGTTTLVQTGGEVEPCGDPKLTECWSAVATSKRTWGPSSITGAISETHGADNTSTILAAIGSFPAAEYCGNLDEDGYTDWYLPSINQLVTGITAQFITSPATVTGFADSAVYWSSTEGSFSGALIAAYYGDGDVSSFNSVKDYANSVRCLR